MDSASLIVGNVIGGRYRIEALLGQGGMAVVYRARHTSTGKLCALKLVRPHLVTRVELIDMFVREAQVAGKIGEHPNIINVFDAGVDEVRKIPFIAMEILQGETIEQYTEKNGPAPRGLVHKIFTQLADALEQAHREGVIHRDLKPSNLFLTLDRKQEPVLKVMDFGIAKVLEQGAQHTATRVGSPAYAAPEQQSGSVFRKLAAGQGVIIAQGVSPATDVWAMGLIAYELIGGFPCGHYWPPAETLNDLMTRIALEETLPPSVRAGDRAALFPPGFDAWFLRCIRKNAAERWPTAGEAVSELGRLLFPVTAFGDKTLKMVPIALQAVSPLPGAAPEDRPRSPSEPDPARVAQPSPAVTGPPSSEEPTHVITPIAGGGDRRSSPERRELPSLVETGITGSLSGSTDAPTQVIQRSSLPAEPRASQPAQPPPRTDGGPLRKPQVPEPNKALALIGLGAAITMVLLVLGVWMFFSGLFTPTEGSPPPVTAVVSSLRGVLPVLPPPSADIDVEPERGDSQQPGEPRLADPGSAPKTKPATTAKLRVVATGAACKVTVDGVPKGITPVSEFSVTPGRHTVLCMTVGTKRERSVTVRAGASVVVEFATSR